jgi:hypothetical protein
LLFHNTVGLINTIQNQQQSRISIHYVVINTVLYVLISINKVERRILKLLNKSKIDFIAPTSYTSTNIYTGTIVRIVSVLIIFLDAVSP